MDNEIRCFKGPIEVKQADGGKPTIAGYGLKWSETIDLDPYGNFQERFKRGAFAKTLADNDVKLMVGHNYEGLPLARVENNTMRVYENTVGLVVEADLDESDPEAESLLKKIRSGLADSMSVGFSMRGGKETIKTGGKDENGDEKPDLRIIEEVGELLEVSVVTWPAYESSSVSMKRAVEHMQAQRKQEIDPGNPDSSIELAVAKAKVKARAIIMGVRIPKQENSHDQS